MYGGIKECQKDCDASETKSESGIFEEEKLVKTIDIRIYGEVQGSIWWPCGAIRTKEFDVHCSYEDKPFCRQIECLRDVLLHITNDGDFQHCEISFAVLTITKQKGLNRLVRERILQGTGENADCFVEDMVVV